MTAQDKRQLRALVLEICDDLRIDAPRVRFTSDGLATPTTLAGTSPDGEEIHLRPTVGPSPDLFFAVAHELRHVWQRRRAPGLLFGHQSSDRLSVEAYNLQPAELDANAYAAAVMESLFGLRPRFDGLPESVRAAIFELMKMHFCD